MSSLIDPLHCPSIGGSRVTTSTRTSGKISAAANVAKLMTILNKIYL
jgi:hypothetical protein